MPLTIVLDDITNIHADVYVNSAQKEAIIGSRIDQRLHTLAGPNLLESRKHFGELDYLTVFKSPGFQLKASTIYHILPPLYETKDSIHILKQTYELCLHKALEEGHQRIAFPLLACHHHGFPKTLALEIALSAFKNFLNHADLDIILVIFDKLDYQINASKKQIYEKAQNDPIEDVTVHAVASYNVVHMPPLSESFHTMLFRIIDENAYSDVEVYKRSNLSRKLFSKIRSDVSYHPSKKTIIALAIGLRLNLDQTLDFLQTTGYTLSRSLPFDRLIEYFIREGTFDIYEINEVLFYYDLPIL